MLWVLRGDSVKEMARRAKSLVSSYKNVLDSILWELREAFLEGPSDTKEHNPEGSRGIRGVWGPSYEGSQRDLERGVTQHRLSVAATARS